MPRNVTPFGLIGLALVLLASGGGVAWAQPGIGAAMVPPGANAASPILIAMSPAVQEELQLNVDQKTKVYNLVQSLSLKQRELTQSIMLGNPTPQQVFQARDGLRKEMEQSLGQIFDKKQNERFLQVVLRAEGPLGVARPEIGSRLGLSQSQTQQVRTIAMQLQGAQRQLFINLRMNGVAAGGLGFNREAVSQFTAASNNLRKEAGQQIGRVLNKKQRDSFDEMLGKPFDLAKLQSDDPSAPAAAAGEKDTAPTDDTPGPDEKPKSAAKKKTRKGKAQEK
jgi:hypothetical protein